MKDSIRLEDTVDDIRMKAVLFKDDPLTQELIKAIAEAVVELLEKKDLNE